MAKKGARIIIAGRNESKCREAIKKLQSESGGSLDLDYVQLDLKSLKSAKVAGLAIVAKEKKLSGIILNAGIMATPYELTDDGVEAQFQVNHLAHFVLVRELMELLESSGKVSFGLSSTRQCDRSEYRLTSLYDRQADGKPARVISLSSFAHNFFSLYPFASPKFTSLADVNRAYDPLGYIRYSQAKLANILFVRELNKRAKNVRAVAVHPGFVASSLYEAQPLLRPFVGTFISVDEGAFSSLWAATSSELDEKDLWFVMPHSVIIND